MVGDLKIKGKRDPDVGEKGVREGEGEVEEMGREGGGWLEGDRK